MLLQLFKHVFKITSLIKKSEVNILRDNIPTSSLDYGFVKIHILSLHFNQHIIINPVVKNPLLMPFQNQYDS